MTTKLTLSVKKEAIEKAKRFSAENGKSVSKLVEEYFDGLTDTSPKSIVQQMEEILAPHRERMNRMIPKGKSPRDAVRDWQWEDYLKKEAERETAAKKKSKR